MQVHRTCSFAGCDKSVQGHGLCGGHYRQRERGRVLAPLHRPGGTCSAPDCDDPAKSLGLCGKHHQRQARLGSLDLPSELERYWSRVDRSGGPTACHPWTGHTDTGGYGEMQFDGRKRKAHRIAWALANGPIPDGLWVLHRCDNPPCVRPEHLFLGTVLDNNADMVAKGRNHIPRPTHCKHGHEFTPENTRAYWRDGRQRRACRECERLRWVKPAARG